MSERIGETLSSDPPPTRGLFFMATMGALVGVVAGLGAVGFRALIALFHNGLFLGQASFSYNANAHTPLGPWGAGIILVPVLGAIVVAFLVKTFAPEAKGHGVPEVMDAIYYGEGKIRPIVAVIKSLASALSIGSGGSVGREGPIVQIGAAFGSTLGQRLLMRTHQRVTLVAAGAGAGIAATFNTPIGGLMFAIELLLPAINSATLLPVAIATVAATCASRYLLGMQPAFDVPALQVPAIHVLSASAYPVFIIFGVLVGLLATVFVRSIYWFEDQFDKMPGNYFTRHMTGMLLVGLLMYGFMKWSGHYYVQGVGYSTVEDILRQQITSPMFLLVLLVAKLLVTNLTLGSGASGGVFSPSLFLGATLGGAFGLLINQLFPTLGLSPAMFAIVGMAGMIAGSTGAIITAMTMAFEMTRDYDAILPMMLTVAIAYMIRKQLSQASIYTLKLLRREHVVPEGLQAAIDSARRAKHVMSRQFETRPFDEEESKEKLGSPSCQGSTSEKASPAPDRRSIAIRLDGHALMIPRPELSDSESESATFVTSPRMASPSYTVVGESDSLGEVLSAMERHHAEVALVSRHPYSNDVTEIVGVITLKQLVAALDASRKLCG